MKEFAIVIPVYKDKLDCVEEISIKRLNTVIGDKGYDVYLVCPKGLKTTVYTKYFKGLKKKEFDPEYFKSTATYSQLCINYDFYNTFSNYKYMFLYQLDCYLFYDAISEWCKKDYDYVGGPILSTDCGWDTVKKSRGREEYRPFVGNGGLSLRKIETFKYLTDPNGEFRTMFTLTDDVLKNVVFEDKYFCNDLYNLYDMDIPDWPEALHFALDMSVDIVYNQMKLDPQPMGIHSVDKNIRFWKKVIPEFGDQKVIDYCEEKHKEFFKLYYDENDSTYREAK